MAKSLKKKSGKNSATLLKDCFIITPIGKLGSDTFKKTDGLIKSVIRPILNELGFEAVPAHEINNAGSITKQIIQHILNDELVICNLTNLNPNVMYELAIRHSFGKKVIIMAEDNTVLPFDISDQRTVFYEDSLLGSEAVKPLLKQAIQSALKEEVKSNPIIDSITERSALDKNNSDSIETSKYLLQRFDRLERFVVELVQSKAYTLSHELRASIATIMGLAALLQTDMENTEREQIINHIERVSTELDQFVYNEWRKGVVSEKIIQSSSKSFPDETTP